LLTQLEVLVAATVQPFVGFGDLYEGFRMFGNESRARVLLDDIDIVSVQISSSFLRLSLSKHRIAFILCLLEGNKQLFGVARLGMGESIGKVAVLKVDLIDLRRVPR
jgi:hypothetical protein